MEGLWIGIAILALLVLFLYTPRNVERMTNKDLLETLKTFGEKGTKPTQAPDNQQRIYGPMNPKLEEPVPVPGATKGKDLNMDYPEIYGPEVTPIPGMSRCKSTPGKNTSDCPDDNPYSFNPDFANAFPNAEGEPQPFLTDFSKFQQ